MNFYNQNLSNINQSNIYHFNLKDKLLDESKLLNEATSIKNKRKEIEDLIYKFFDILDKSGKNTKKYKDFFSPMKDTEFKSYMDKFLKDDKENFYLEIFPFESEPTLKQIKASAKLLNIELDEYVYLPFENPDGPAVRTITPVMVGYMPAKRMQQILSKKNSYSIKISKRDGKTGFIKKYGSFKISLIAGIV